MTKVSFTCLMGSVYPPSPPKLFLVDLENQAMHSAEFQPRPQLRDVDDTFCCQASRGGGDPPKYNSLLTGLK